MMSAEKLAVLKDFLSRLPRRAAVRLAMAVEADRTAGGKQLPHDTILEALRPRLRYAASDETQEDDDAPMAEAPQPSREQLFGEIEAQARAIRSAKRTDFDESVLAAALGSFAELSNRMVKETGAASGKWGERLARTRAAVAEAMDNLIERAPKEILAALPVQRVGSFGAKNPRRLDLTRAPDGEKIARAKRYAGLIMQCRPYAAALGFDEALSAALDESEAGLTRYGEDIVREVRASAPSTRAQAEAHLNVAADLYTMMLGKKEADRLRQRSRIPADA